MVAGGGAVRARPLLPVLPRRTLHTVPLQKINSDLGEQIAWPREVALVARVYESLPAAQRSRTALLAGNYGEAGAIDRYGAQFGLPRSSAAPTTSGSGGRRPPPTRRPSRSTSTRPCSAASSPTSAWSPRSGTGSACDDDEQGAPVFLATGLKSSWRQAWPAFRDYA